MRLNFASVRVLPQIACGVLLIGLSGIFFTTKHHGILQGMHITPHVCILYLMKGDALKQILE